MSWIRKTGRFLWLTLEECQRDNTPLLAAALAFYTLLSLAPTLWVAVAVAGIWFGRESARAEVVSAAHEAIGEGGANIIAGVLEKIEANSPAATVVGILSLLFGATIVFAALQDSLNAIWHVPPRRWGYVRGFLFRRFISFLLVIMLGLLLFASLIISAFISGAAKLVPESLPASETILELVNFAASLMLMTVLFGVVYRMLPDATVEWRDVWTGAAVTSFLLMIGKTLIGLYLGHTTLGSVYGAAGSLAVFLLWIYYSAQIFLFGAEFTEVHARLRGVPIGGGQK